MKTIYLRALADEAATTDDAGSPIRFVASTEGVKRDGLDLKAEDWNLDNYRKNPVFLWVHDHMGTRLPIGRADANIDAEAKRLVTDVIFDQEDDFARTVESKYRRGFLHAVSVGWGETDAGLDLQDISAVPVPADPDALMERQMSGMRSLISELDRVMQPGSGVRVGAVLNARNRDALERAKELIQQVLDSAKKPESDDDDDDGRVLDGILSRLNHIGAKQ